MSPFMCRRWASSTSWKRWGGKNGGSGNGGASQGVGRLVGKGLGCPQVGWEGFRKGGMSPWKGVLDGWDVPKDMEGVWDRWNIPR